MHATPPSTLSHTEARRIRKRVLDQRKLESAGKTVNTPFPLMVLKNIKY
jgi:alkaline phosphatase